jgi:hypothetical protein
MKNKLALENNFLFLELPEAISNLKERISRSGKRKHLMIILSKKIMSVANQIADACGVSEVITFYGAVRLVNRNFNEIQFDLNTVRESGRDVPQDFIFHEERNLKARMISWYQGIYNELTPIYPDRGVILADFLLSDGLEFRHTRDILNLSVDNKALDIKKENTDAANEARRFIYLHSVQGDGDGVNMIIQQPVG